MSAAPKPAPECGTLDHLVACGPGVERIAEEVFTHFPDARTIVLSSDLMGGRAAAALGTGGDRRWARPTSSSARSWSPRAQLPQHDLGRRRRRRIFGLANGDPRAAERTSSCSAKSPAAPPHRQEVWACCDFQPDHPVMRAIVSGDAEAFYERRC